MANELVQVELIANPAVKRTMTMASYRNNAHKWRIVGAEQQTAPVAQKKSVEPAVVEIISITQTPPPVTDFVDPTQTATGSTGEETVTTTEPTGLVDGLRAQYKALTGKDADKRMGVKKLSEAIKNFNPSAQ